MLVSCVCVCDWFDDLMILLKKKKTNIKVQILGEFCF